MPPNRWRESLLSDYLPPDSDKVASLHERINLYVGRIRSCDASNETTMHANSRQGLLVLSRSKAGEFDKVGPVH